MKVARALCYRVEQFVRALIAEHAVPEQRIRKAASILSPEARALFLQQAPQDQLHALAVYETLLGEGYTHKELLEAALLHDVGKAAVQLRPWQRGIFVLTERFAPWAWRYTLPGGADGSQSPLAAYANHAEIGARRADKAGCSPLTVRLIRFHEGKMENCGTETAKLLTALQNADSAN